MSGVSQASEYKLYVDNTPGEQKFGVQMSSNSIILYADGDEDSSFTQADKDAKVDSFGDSMWSLIKDSIPMVLTLVAFQMVGLITVYFIGQLNDPAVLAGVGLGTMMINCMCFAIIQGLNGAIESPVAMGYGKALKRLADVDIDLYNEVKVSQDFGYAMRRLLPGQDKNYISSCFQECGATLNQAKVITTIVMVPIFMFYFFMDRALMAVKQDEGVSIIARNYVCMAIPGIWCQMQFDSRKRFLQSMSFSNISTRCTFVTTAIHLFWCWLFINNLEMGYKGAAMALNITYVSCFICQEAYLMTCGKSLTAPMHKRFLDQETFTGWGPFISQAIGTTMLQCFEWWAFEVLAIFAGWMEVTELSAQVAVINIVALCYMIPMGVQFAVSAKIGFSIGENRIKQAQRYAMLSIALIVCITTTVCLLMNIFKQSVSTLFTDEESTVAHFQACIPVLSFFLLLNAIHGVQTGLVRSLKRPTPAAIVTLVSYYAIGLPMSLYFGFKGGMGISGLWLGMCIAEVILDIGVASIILSADWYFNGKGPSTAHIEVCDDKCSQEHDHTAPEFTLKESFIPGEDKMTQL